MIIITTCVALTISQFLYCWSGVLLLLSFVCSSLRDWCAIFATRVFKKNFTSPHRILWKQAFHPRTYPHVKTDFSWRSILTVQSYIPSAAVALISYFFFLKLLTSTASWITGVYRQSSNCKNTPIYFLSVKSWHHKCLAWSLFESFIHLSLMIVTPTYLKHTW